MRIAERVAFGMLKVDEREFRRLTLLRITRAREWFVHEDEARLIQTRLICYYSGNHDAKSPLDLWMTNAEIKQRQMDIIHGRVSFARFRTLTPEEVAKWKTSIN